MLPDPPILPTRSDSEPTDPTDVAFSPDLVRAVITGYSKPGDLVLDLFAGSGTTLWVAESLGRQAIGLEILPEIAEQARARLRDPSALVVGDARQVRSLAPDRAASILTSPPYMTSGDHPQNPLSGYRELDGDYQTNLTESAQILFEAMGLLTSEGVAVVNVADMRHGDISTSLATDLRRKLEPLVCVDQEIVMISRNPADWMVRDVCLVLRPPR